MAFRSDINIEWSLSPRIITVALPATNLTIQDLYDTLAELQQYQQNLIYPEVVSAGGKETLGGGAFVAVTLTLLDARLRFESRKTPQSTGTATTGSSDGLNLIDSSATFISDGVEAGATVVNLTDGSQSAVNVVVSETQLLLDGLNGGTEGDWDIGDGYRVTNTVACEVTGGNLVAEDSVGDPLAPILGSSNTTVTISQAAATAALDQEQVIEATAREIEDAIYFDTVRGTSGTSDSNGTLSNPVDNVADALTLLTARQKSKIRIVEGTFTLDRTLDNVKFIGEINKLTAIVDFNGYNVTAGAYERVTLTGDANGSDVFAESCLVSGLNDVKGIFKVTAIATMTGPDAAGTLVFHQCFAEPTGTSYAVLDLRSGVSNDCVIRSFSGGIELTNIDQATQDVSVDLDSGLLKLASSCTDGTVVLRGVGTFTDESAGTAVVRSGFISRTDLQEIEGLVVIS